MNIKTFIISIIILSTAIFAGCKSEKFEYKLTKAGVADVDSIYFSAGDVMMIADGKATLKFVVETYKKFKKADGTVTREFFDYRQLPEGTLKIYETVTNKEVGLTFSTATMPAGTLKFYAQIGNIKSEVKEVVLRPKPEPLPKVYVDVIFHVWELNPTNTTYDASSFQPTKYEDIVQGLKVMNDIINNRIGNAANGAAANVEFRLATKNLLGQDLVQPGYDKIVYSDEIKTVPTAPTISLGDFSAYIDKNTAKYIWDPKTYLNINVLPSGSNNTLGNLYPAKQLQPGQGESLILGVPDIATGPDDYVNSFLTTTVFLPNTLFNPGYERRIEIFSFIGNFYGLYATSSYSTARYHSDYCEDTQQYNPQDATVNNFFFATKTGLDGNKFIIENAMDDTRYPSSRNSLTLDQVNRMRAVMARCPGRMNSKTQ